MAFSSSLPEAGVHLPVRSISLPSGSVRPNSLKIEAILNKLKNWQISPSFSPNVVDRFGAETIQIGLVALAELYNCVDELIQSPLTQQALLRYQYGKLVEEALEGSITLIDTCGAARDILLMMNEHLQTLQSALRRRGGDSSIESHISAYIIFRKKVKKDVAKHLRALKQMESKSESYPLSDMDHHLSMAVRVLREASTITISIFRSLLLFLSMPAMNSKAGGWSLIATKLMPSRLLSAEKGRKIINEVGRVDVMHHSLNGHARNKNAKAEVQMAGRMLEPLDVSIGGLEAELNCIFRCLVQKRVSFLNILTNHLY